ncbi:SRPBCC family protein [Planococcus soli]|uniref:SRPBCC family protein n=1 Tax=Planococcus soli TaxID=2666072 RepID=UPI00115DB073|nr:SRPBCC domain-containing protein [Planococcus soli]
MIRIHLERVFNVGPELLWELVVDPDHYRFWTEAFSEGSEFKGEWTKGSPIRFVVEDENGKESGMLSEIAESRWPEFISIKHVGLVMNGEEDYDSLLAQEWSPAFENYRFIPKEDGTCIFEVEQDLPEEQAEEFKGNWEKSFDLMAIRLETSGSVGKMITLREKSRNRPEVIWKKLVTPENVMSWNYASDDWHCPTAENNLVIGGEFHYEMAAKDGSVSFDYWGTYTEIEPAKRLYFVLGDGRKVRIDIFEKPYGCLIEERFEAEQQNNLHLQRQGWQNILKNLAR